MDCKKVQNKNVKSDQKTENMPISIKLAQWTFVEGKILQERKKHQLICRLDET